MADVRPQVGGVFVAEGKYVGVCVGGTVAVRVTDTVGELVGAATMPGAEHPAITDTSRIQEIRSTFRQLLK